MHEHLHATCTQLWDFCYDFFFFLCDQVMIVYQDTQNEGTQVSHRDCLGKHLYHGQHFLIFLISQPVEPLESPEVILSLSLA